MKHYHREVLLRLKAEGYEAEISMKGTHFKLHTDRGGRAEVFTMSITPTNEHGFVRAVLRDVKRRYAETR